MTRPPGPDSPTQPAVPQLAARIHGPYPTDYPLPGRDENEDPYDTPPRALEVEPGIPADKFPVKLAPLFIRKRWRYKVIPGGRGGGRSWGAIRAALRMGAAECLRFACIREIQKSIKDSMHQLLCDQIDEMGLRDFYQPLESEIRGANGTTFVFKGLSNITAVSLKSLEGADIAIVDEAQTITKRSLRILSPTIRRPDSEIWLLLNPELETDPVYEEFVATPHEDTLVIWMSWRDNPFFPPVLEKERLKAKASMPAAEYNNIWGGRPKAAVTGAIFGQEIADAMGEQRITRVPYDPRLRVHPVLDLGWNDKMFVALVQRQISEVRIIEAWQVDHKTLDWVSGKLREKPRNWGTMFLPHDGTHGDYKTGKSTKELMEEKGWTVKITHNVPIEVGIKRAREALPRTYIDATNAATLVQSLRRYRRVENPRSDEFGRPLHDDASHGGDCFRYIALNLDRMTNFSDIVLPGRHQVIDYPVDPRVGM